MINLIPDTNTMDYCTAHFGKKLNELKLEDIQAFFSQERNETDQLEFKSASPGGVTEDHYNSLKRSLCAFLNSSGGVLIWGSPPGQKTSSKSEKTYKGAVSFIPVVLEKDFVISKTSDAITPLPNNIRAQIIPENEGCVIVFELDASAYAPHQFNNQYMMRIDGQSKPAPHHYIEALFKRVRYPNIEAYLKIISTTVDQIPMSTQSRMLVHFQLIFCNWSALQNEEKLSYRLIANGKFRGGLVSPNSYGHYHELGGEIRKNDIKDVFYYGEPFRENHHLWFEFSELQKNKNIGTLMVLFGGRFSPMKSSHFELDFTKFNNDSRADILEIKYENMLTKDLHEMKNVSKQSIVESLLK